MPIPTTDPRDTAPRQLARERVLTQIRDAILQGVLQPGERLDEASLRAWLGVSATPIRQALHALVLEGLVESAPQSHTIVATPKPERVVANMQTVGVLLLGVVALALPLLSDDERERLAARAGDVATHLAAGEIAEASQLSGAFFMPFIDRCPNGVLVDLTRRVGTSLGYQVFTTHSALADEMDSVVRAYRTLESALRASEIARVLAAIRQAFLIESSR